MLDDQQNRLGLRPSLDRLDDEIRHLGNLANALDALGVDLASQGEAEPIGKLRSSALYGLIEALQRGIRETEAKAAALFAATKMESLQ